MDFQYRKQRGISAQNDFIKTKYFDEIDNVLTLDLP